MEKEGRKKKRSEIKKELKTKWTEQEKQKGCQVIEQRNAKENRKDQTKQTRWQEKKKVVQKKNIIDMC